METLPLLQQYQKSFVDNYELPALTDYVTGHTLTYGEFAKKIARIHLLYRACNLQCGDKVAILGKNTPEWVAVFMATLTYGAVVVPILNDFNPLDAQHIVNHSESKLLFVSESIYEHMDFGEMPKVEAAVSLDRPEVLDQKGRSNFKTAMRELPKLFAKVYPNGFGPKYIKYPKMKPSDLGILNYTSGTTGFSKGVMLTHDNINGNVIFGIQSHLHYQAASIVVSAAGSRLRLCLRYARAIGGGFACHHIGQDSHAQYPGKSPGQGEALADNLRAAYS